LVFLIFILTVVISQNIHYIATDYDSPVPKTHHPREKISYRASLCDASLYRGCAINATYNMPLDPYDYFDGRFLNFTLYSEDDGCNVPLCQTNPRANNHSRTSCQTSLSATFKGNLIMVVDSGNTPSISATVSIKFHCPSNLNVQTIVPTYQKTGSVNFFIKKNIKNICPSGSIEMKQSLQLDAPDKVLTSPSYIDAKKYKFIACGIVDRIQYISITVSGTDIDSAIATYVCTETPCGPQVAKYYDPSGTALNTINFDLPRNEYHIYWITVYG